MNSYPSLDSGIAPGGSRASAWEAAVSKQILVQSNKAQESVAASAPPMDAAAIERSARIARSVWIGSKLKSYYVALVRKFERGGQAELENYLAASQSLADLEDRIRRYERSNAPHF